MKKLNLKKYYVWILVAVAVAVAVYFLFIKESNKKTSNFRAKSNRVYTSPTAKAYGIRMNNRTAQRIKDQEEMTGKKMRMKMTKMGNY